MFHSQAVTSRIDNVTLALNYGTLSTEDASLNNMKPKPRDRPVFGSVFIV